MVPGEGEGGVNTKGRGTVQRDWESFQQAMVRSDTVRWPEPGIVQGEIIAPILLPTCLRRLPKVAAKGSG